MKYNKRYLVYQENLVIDWI